jgi:serine O-acetyltransferase
MTSLCSENACSENTCSENEFAGPVAYPATRRAAAIQFYWSIRKILVSPLLGLLPIGHQGAIIREDTGQWIRNLFARDYHGLSDLLLLLARYREFRSLYYYRLSRGSLAGEAASMIARNIFKPMPTLHLTCPSIGPGFFIQHGYATALSAQSIGKNCSINQCAAVGWTDRSRPPVIGDNVHIKNGAKVLGPITVGDNVTIGANAVVVKDVPSNCVVVGVPARIVRRNGVRVDEKL